MKTNKQLQEERMLKAHLDFYTVGGVPSDDQLAKYPLIEDWCVVITKLVTGIHYFAVKGRLYRSKAVPVEGWRFMSRSVIWFDRHHRFIRCADSLYQLGRQVGQKGTA